MKQTRSLSEFSRLSEYTRLYPIYLRQIYFVRSLNSSCRVSKLAKLETLYLDEAIPKSSVSFVSPIPTENIVMPVEK